MNVLNADGERLLTVLKEPELKSSMISCNRKSFVMKASVVVVRINAFPYWDQPSEGVNACYQQNVHGIIEGNCGYDVHSRAFTRCLPEDIMCGRQQCGTLAERPVFGDPTTVASAYTYVRDLKVIIAMSLGQPMSLSRRIGQILAVLDGSQCRDDKGKLECDVGDGVLNYSVNERPPSFIPPAIPLVSISPSSPYARSSDQLQAHVPVSSSYSKPKIDLPSPPPDDPDDESSFMKKDTIRSAQPPPLPPSKQKRSLNLENVDRPPLPQKPPKVLGRTETGVGVRELGAKFDAELHET
ncbi:hypothetical protein KIN20_011730 [Parelaphostrongylus tenuis]|uniref:ADAM cysteine-rich domain-containing protein n=1 Tax=Parelaphostrongylus tenuis TaxID=148309 RepID=A0AAD5MVG1_PARTN|nr:hypothetical protein KIN20_011730 [Parelaphostrongylus tenuis]